jgi:single-strand DNA-binding protein
MADLNKVFIIGRLTHDPELRYTPNGVAVSDLRVATSRSWTSKDGERKEDKLFIDVTVWNRQAENCCQYLKKGRQVHVEGYLRSESWETPAGEKRSKIKVEAERVQFLDRKDDAGGPSEASGADEDYVPSAREPKRAVAGAEPRMGGNGPGRSAGSASPPARGHAAGSGDEEDIPF